MAPVHFSSVRSISFILRSVDVLPSTLISPPNPGVAARWLRGAPETGSATAYTRVSALPKLRAVPP